MKKLLWLVLLLFLAVGGDALFRMMRAQEDVENRLPPFPQFRESTEKSPATDDKPVDPFLPPDPIDRGMLGFDERHDEVLARPGPTLSRFDPKTDTKREIPVDDCLRFSLILQKQGKNIKLKELARQSNRFVEDPMMIFNYISCQSVTMLDPSWCDVLEREGASDSLVTRCRFESVIYGLIPYYYFSERTSELRFNRLLQSKNVAAADEWVKVYRVFGELQRGELDEETCEERYPTPVMETVCTLALDPAELTRLGDMAGPNPDFEDFDPGDIDWYIHSIRTRDTRYLRFFEEAYYKTWAYSLLTGKSYCGEMMNYTYARSCGIDYPLPY